MVLVTDDSTDEELREAITHLRARQRKAVIPSTRDEINDAINDLLDTLAARRTTTH